MKVGDKIELRKMRDDPRPIKPGTRGVITSISQPINIGDGFFRQIGVNWDSGRGLMLCCPPDTFTFVNSDNLLDS